MYGKIIFANEEALAKFLLAFQGSTALFKVESFDGTAYLLEFTGGY